MNLSDYRAIRASGKELGSKIFKYAVDNNKNEMISAAKLLGLWNGKMFTFDSENDLLDNDRKEYQLMDIGLSKTAPVGFVLFTRLIPIRDINMTSGATFRFKSMYKDKLLSAISLATFQKRRKLNSNEIYVLMHNKNGQFGMETITE